MRTRRIGAVILAATVLVFAGPQAAADPNALWDIVNGRCVPDQLANGDPAPCARVDVAGGYAVLKDLVGATQFLLIPTARVAGMESPQIVDPHAPNYFAAAWRARSFVEERAGRAIPRDWMSLAINSAAARTQDQLHIHIDCVRADVRQALAAHARDVVDDWTPFPVPLAGQRYRAVTVWDAELAATNPLMLLADNLPPGGALGDQTLAVVGITGADERPGFVLLAGQADPADPAGGHSEDLQDHLACPPPAEVVGK